MFQPFAELTNRTPSPAQPDNDVKYRKHSPWTAARQKKKTRSVQEDKSNIQRSYVPADCFNSPEVQVKSGGVANRVQPEFSLTDGLSPAASQSSGSSHSSPPIDRGEDAEIHPAKAYIVDSQDASSPDLLAKFALAANAGVAPRSPMWFGSAALQEEVLTSGVPGQASSLQHSSSAPSNVFAQSHPLYSQQHADGAQLMDHGRSDAHVDANATTAVAPVSLAGLSAKRRGLMARRRSWGGAEQSNLPNSAAAAGASAATGSRLATASHCVAGRATSGVRDPSTASLPDGFSSNSRMGTVAWDCKQLQQQPQETTRLDGVAFQLHSRLEAVSTYSQSSLLREQAWCTRSELLQQGSGAAQHQQVSASEVEPCHGSVQWFEGKLQEAAEEGDTALAAQLWQVMQAGSILPSRKVMNNYLMCWHYGGGDPIEAEQVVREMCGTSGMEPDGTTARWLAAIDISWQQLHCGF